MPTIQFYANQEDFEAIFARLSGDEHIAVIAPTGEKSWLGKRKWIARRPVGELADGAHCLWHVPAGPLPLLKSGAIDEPTTPIADPFEGWTEKFSGSDLRVPFFGSVPAIVTLNVNRHSRETDGGIGQSAFGWIGNRYRSEGLAVAPATEKWWRELSRWVASTAVKKITRWGDPDEGGPQADVWAFGSAYEKIRSGVPRDANPTG